MERFRLPEDKVYEFMAHLGNQGELYGPVRSDGRLPKFDRVTDPTSVQLDYQTTVLPPKRFFQQPEEEIFTFDRSSFQVTPAQVPTGTQKILVGIHNYDAAAIAYLDYQMARGVPDEGWQARRQDWVFIGVSYEPDEHHFAPSVGIGVDCRTGLDLFMDKAQGGYNLEVLTDKGKALLAGFHLDPDPLPALPKPRFTNRVLAMPQDLPKIMARSHDHPIWSELAERCFSCGSCTLVCPTCYCFDIADHLHLDLKTGVRKRSWHSCQTAEFTRVAGDHIFRKERSSRIRHRIYRKFFYITRHYGKPFCVGCGRCIRACTARISISEVANRLAQTAV